MKTQTPITHVSFDLGGTLARENSDYRHVHDELRYQTYSEAVHKPLTDEVRREFDAQYQKHGTSSAVFQSLGFPSDYWQLHFNTLDRSKFYFFDPIILETILKLKEIVPLSIFSTIKKDAVYQTLKLVKLKPEYFRFIIFGDDTKARKPDLEGFYLIVSKAQTKPQNILYVGDRVSADIIPAHKVGMQTCLMWGSAPEADYCFDDFSQILKLISN